MPLFCFVKYLDSFFNIHTLFWLLSIEIYANY